MKLVIYNLLILLLKAIEIEGIEQILPIDMEEILLLLTGKRKNLSGFMQ
jgi:hypothetical protein